MKNKVMNFSTKYLLAALCGYFSFSFNSASAQEVLSYSQALEIALKNNFNVKNIRFSASISENDAQLGNAGFLPEINASATYSDKVQDTKITFFDGRQMDVNNAETKLVSAGVDLTWTLFDGTKMFVQYDKLVNLKEAGKTQLKAQINNTLSEVALTYNQIIRIKESLDLLRETTVISRERVQLENNKLIIGTGSELEVYQAKTDLNADTSAYMKQLIQYQSIKKQLNNQLGLNPENAFEIDDYWKDPQIPDLSASMEKAKAQNPDIQQQALLLKDNELAVRSIQAEYSPTLDFNLGYAYSNQTAQAGQVKLSTANGLSYGLTARWNLFQGLNQSRRIQNAKIQQKMQLNALESLENALETQVLTNWQSLYDSRSIANLEQNNFEFAQKTLDISREKYNQGLISAVEFREAQRNWLNARLRLLNAEFDVRIYFIEIMRLTGSFINPS